VSDVVEVRVPASTSNLGPGYDALGLAVDRYLTLTWRSSAEPAVVATGERPPAGFGDRLRAAVRRGPTELGLPPSGRLEIHSEIPVGRGLGSSAALGVGLEMVRDLVDGRTPERGRILDVVAVAEGHPDNCAPALHGGLVACAAREGGVQVVPLPLSSRIGWAWAAPTIPADTAAMRAALPSAVPHAAAVRNGTRLAHLIPALAAGDGETLAWAMEDELHVPMRLPLIPGAAAAREAALAAGAWACTLSGAGSGLLAAAPPERTSGIAEAMADALGRVDPDPQRVPAFVLTPDPEGARWRRGGSAALTPPGAPEDAPPTRRG